CAKCRTVRRAEPCRSGQGRPRAELRTKLCAEHRIGLRTRLWIDKSDTRYTGERHSPEGAHKMDLGPFEKRLVQPQTSPYHAIAYLYQHTVLHAEQWTELRPE